MASFHARPSILLRPRKVSGTTVVAASTLETEHSREQARVNARRDERLKREATIAARHWGSAEDKAQLAAREKAVHDKHMEARRLVEQQERAEGARLEADALGWQEKQRAAEMAREAAKREYLTRIKEDNQRLAEQRRVMQQHQRVEEKQYEARQIQTPENILSKFGRHAY